MWRRCRGYLLTLLGAGAGQFFNTRTTQLVLGAGAINSAARLRSITAKHLGRSASAPNAHRLHTLSL